MNPFIPLKKANLAIVDGRISDEIKNNLEELNIKVIKTVKCKEVDESISYHPDIVIHPINHNTLIIAPNVFGYYEDKLKGLGIELIMGKKYLDCKYPADIAYNVGRLSEVAIHNFKYTDEVLKFFLVKQGIEFINVRQGYSKCSLAIINEKAAITSDYPIYQKLNSLGYKVLLIQPGYIDLEGQEYGFIGGCTGNLSDKTVIFSGNLDSHPDADKILRFIAENGVKSINLSGNRLQDIGTIITLNSQ